MVLFQQAIPILIMKEKEKQVFRLESEKVKEVVKKKSSKFVWPWRL
tara:strand:+ start:319 stop:456 length:138 start_codon:yes stop_codon:yes gene_type:complete